jgi:hypothetical protein
LEQWTGTHYEKTSLRSFGQVIHLGHQGQPCPNNFEYQNGWEDSLNHTDDDQIRSEDIVDGSGSSEMTLIHVNGVHTTAIAWCMCNPYDPALRYTQLLARGLFPASFQRPQTAFTFELLDLCWIDNLECNTATSGLFTKIQRLTDPVRFRQVKVCPSHQNEDIIQTHTEIGSIP